MRGSFMGEDGEISWLPALVVDAPPFVVRGVAWQLASVARGTLRRYPSMNDREKSDGLVVPAIPPNNASLLAAEALEERRPAKGNAASKMHPGHSAGPGALSALDRVRQKARTDKKARFTTLLHHVDVDARRSNSSRPASRKQPRTARSGPYTQHQSSAHAASNGHPGYPHTAAHTRGATPGVAGPPFALPTRLRCTHRAKDGTVPKVHLRIGERVGMGESEVWADWLRGGSPWKGPLLVLLLDQPGHSYELASRLTRRVGPAWKLDPNDATRVLQRAEELGLATSKWANSKHSRRPVQVYEPTPLTGPAVEHWMRSPLVDDPYRFEMWTRIVVSGPEHADALLAALSVCERRVFGLLREYGKPYLTETWAGLELEIARNGVTMRLEADVMWIEKTRKQIREFARQHGAA